MAVNLGWGVGSEILAMLVTMTTFMALGRTLGAHGYGGYAAVYAIAGPLITWSSVGAGMALMDHVLRGGEPLAETTRSCLSISLLFGVLSSAISIVAALFIVEDIATMAVVALVVTELLTTPVVMLISRVAQTENDFVRAVQIPMILYTCKLIVVLTLWATGTLTVLSLAVSMLVCSVVLALVLSRWVSRRYSMEFAPGAVEWKHLKTNAVYSVGTTAAGFNNDGDKVFLTARGMQEIAGLYSAAGRIVNLGLIPIGTLLHATHRRFLINDPGRRGQHVRLALRLSGAGLAYSAVAITAVDLIAPVLPRIVGDSFSSSVEMVRWLSPIIAIRTVTSFAMNGLMGLGKTHVRSMISISNAVIAIGLYIVLIPRFDWRGAAAATLLAESIECITAWTLLVWFQRTTDRQADLRQQAELHGAEAGS